MLKDVTESDKIMSFKEGSILSSIVISKETYSTKVDELFQVEVLSELNSSKRRIILTRDQLLLTPEGCKNVDSLRSGQSIYNYDYILSDEQIQVALGSGLADSNVLKDNENIPTVRYVFSRVAKNPHIDLHNKILETFEDIVSINKDRISGYGSKIKVANTLSIRTAPEFMYDLKNIRKSSYKLNQSILSNLDALGLTIFYLDDGTKRMCRDDGDDVPNITPRVSFSVYKFPYDEILLFQKFLYSKFNIKSEIKKDKILSNGKQSFRVDINTEGTVRFFDLISKYVPMSMRYKLSKKWRDIPEYKWWEQKGKYGAAPHFISKVNTYKHPTGHNKRNSISLEIQSNQPYIVEGFIIK
ncbi:hypothetical protein [Bacillus sp. UMB0728]|uniref:hypothetical protein n=1 Tax=Bacillus sp. UMB0728 TaxID=2066052 RepID=UPI000C75FE43|nr:hypothetical protein [Bacillus sp. UMB0728]PLR72227.1 hypothetical protein CYJ37_11775 [Bacillus sp. UMB0728]